MKDMSINVDFEEVDLVGRGSFNSISEDVFIVNAGLSKFRKVKLRGSALILNILVTWRG